MITTFPGLYLTSLPFTQLFKFVETSLPFSSCSTSSLRLINCIYSIALLFIFRLIFRKNTQYPNVVILLSSLSCFFLPNLYFFGFLFYTDVGSTFFVFLMYYLVMNNDFIFGGLTGILALSFRQTNVIWIAFVCFLKIDEMYNLSRTNNILQFLSVILKNIIQILRICIIQIITILAFGIFVIWNGGIVVGMYGNPKK